MVLLGFPGVSVGKESFRSAEDLGLISGLERSLGEGKGYSLQWGLTKSEDIKKRWQEYTEELYKKDLHHPENHDGVITHLEPDNLECEVKWALGNKTMNKASGGDGFPVELFQILKESAALNMAAKLENSAEATGLENVSFHSNP